MENQTIAQLEETARTLRQLQRNAADMKNAEQFGRLETELENVYRKIDQLKKQI
jgi:hypothetical protein